MTAASAPLLRFITAGSVDDGKSTLIGRLLYDSKTLLTDQLDKLNRAAENGETPDFASLTDGLFFYCNFSFKFQNCLPC